MCPLLSQNSREYPKHIPSLVTLQRWVRTNESSQRNEICQRNAVDFYLYKHFRWTNVTDLLVLQIETYTGQSFGSTSRCETLIRHLDQLVEMKRVIMRVDVFGCRMYRHIGLVPENVEKLGERRVSHDEVSHDEVSHDEVSHDERTIDITSPKHLFNIENRPVKIYELNIRCKRILSDDEYIIRQNKMKQEILKVVEKINRENNDVHDNEPHFSGKRNKIFYSYVLCIIIFLYIVFSKSLKILKRENE
jgi:hypothetical protein